MMRENTPDDYVFFFTDGASAPSASQSTGGTSDPGPIRATAPMWRCSRIMHMQRDLHPTLLSSLEGIVDQVKITRSKIQPKCYDQVFFKMFLKCWTRGSEFILNYNMLLKL
jgi:hypothetical protein